MVPIKDDRIGKLENANFNVTFLCNEKMNFLTGCSYIIEKFENAFKSYVRTQVYAYKHTHTPKYKCTVL
jgi:hypothetical protein